jgi:hypothetical protein
VNSWFHAQSCSKKWGGSPEDYLAIHSFIDSSKQVIGDVRHRSLYHHTLGVFLCERIFGATLTVGRKEIPVRLIAEQHILEDLGWLPSPADYIDGMPIKAWMSGSKIKEVPLSTLLGDLELKHAVLDGGRPPALNSTPTPAIPAFT